MTPSVSGKITTARHDPKPCPTCYQPMTQTGKTWRCDKHGEPTKP